MILALSVIYLGGSPPEWMRGVAAGAGAAVVAVVVQAGVGFGRAALDGREGAQRVRAIAYALIAATVTIVAGAWVVLALVGCGLFELLLRRSGWAHHARVARDCPRSCSRRRGSRRCRISCGRRSRSAP